MCLFLSELGKVLEEIIRCTYYLVISDLTIHELSRKTRLSRGEIIDTYLREFLLVEKLTIVEVTSEDWNQAKILSRELKLHLKDALHFFIAEKSGCTLVTEDVELKSKAKGRIVVKSLEEL